MQQHLATSNWEICTSCVLFIWMFPKIGVPQIIQVIRPFECWNKTMTWWSTISRKHKKNPYPSTYVWWKQLGIPVSYREAGQPNCSCHRCGIDQRLTPQLWRYSPRQGRSHGARVLGPKDCFKLSGIAWVDQVEIGIFKNIFFLAIVAYVFFGLCQIPTFQLKFNAEIHRKPSASGLFPLIGNVVIVLIMTRPVVKNRSD